MSKYIWPSQKKKTTGKNDGSTEVPKRIERIRMLRISRATAISLVPATQYELTVTLTTKLKKVIVIVGEVAQKEDLQYYTMGTSILHKLRMPAIIYQF